MMLFICYVQLYQKSFLDVSEVVSFRKLQAINIEMALLQISTAAYQIQKKTDIRYRSC